MPAQTQTSGSFLFPSDLGWMAVAYSGSRLTRLTFGHPSATAAISSLEADDAWIETSSDNAPPWIAELVGRLQSFAAGNDEPFSDVPLDLAHLSDFQSRVVRACRRIQRGRVRTYGELAALAGAIGAARAVGSVMARNRFPIIIPCHRVVASNSLGGFTARDGLNLKRRMLEMEGVATKKPQNYRRWSRARSSGVVS